MSRGNSVSSDGLTSDSIFEDTVMAETGIMAGDDDSILSSPASPSTPVSGTQATSGTLIISVPAGTVCASGFESLRLSMAATDGTDRRKSQAVASHTGKEHHQSNPQPTEPPAVSSSHLVLPAPPHGATLNNGVGAANVDAVVRDLTLLTTSKDDKMDVHVHFGSAPQSTSSQVVMHISVVKLPGSVWEHRETVLPVRRYNKNADSKADSKPDCEGKKNLAQVRCFL